MGKKNTSTRKTSNTASSTPAPVAAPTQVSTNHGKMHRNQTSYDKNAYQVSFSSSNLGLEFKKVYLNRNGKEISLPIVVSTVASNTTIKQEGSHKALFLNEFGIIQHC